MTGLFNYVKGGLTAKKLVDIFTNRKKLSDDAKKKSEFVMSSKDKDGNLIYPNADKDLLSHYFLSGHMTNEVGPGLSFAIGVGKEALDSQRFPYLNPSQGYFKNSTGFSMDDLGADYAGATNMDFNEAYKRGLFTHTESVPQNNDWSQPSVYGYGEGNFKKVIEKFK
jgi:hypothetical protein